MTPGLCFPHSPGVEFHRSRRVRTCVRSWGVVRYERAPARCPFGHRLTRYTVLVGWIPCDCTPGAGGHRTWTCRNRAELHLVQAAVDINDVGWRRYSIIAGVLVIGNLRVALELVPGPAEMLEYREMPLSFRTALRGVHPPMSGSERIVRLDEVDGTAVSFDA